MSSLINRSQAMIGLSPNRSGPESRAARARANAYYGNQGGPQGALRRAAGQWISGALLGRQQSPQTPASRKLLGG